VTRYKTTFNDARSRTKAVASVLNVQGAQLKAKPAQA